MFREPEVVTPETIRKLEELVADSPLHIPLTLAVIESFSFVFPDIPVVLIFETSFFTSLPPREYHYGLDTELQKDMKIRKFGFNGIFHEAACGYITQLWRKKEAGAVPRIISICLEPRPEVAAAIGNRAVMTTGGVTPLEGIPGQTTSGEIDPTILLTLVQKKGWGPEEINNILTRQSGLLGLTGQPITFEEFFSSENSEYKLAREVIRYRILLACGSGIAAMGGCDAVVFSGRYAYMGEFLGPWLTSKLNLNNRLNRSEFICDTFYEMHDKIIADTARTLVNVRKNRCQAPIFPV
jgi:acetate kinase